jgi:type I restriction enzyme, S subunit
MSEGNGLPRGKIKALDPSVLPTLPPSWCWVSLNDLASTQPHAITDGPFGSHLKTEHYTDTGPRVIRLQNIGDGVFNDEYAHITDKHYQQLLRHSVQAGDIVVAGLGETLPRACVIPDWVGPAIVKADCPRVRLDVSVALSEFVCLALNSSGVQRRTSTVIHGVGRPRLNLAEIRGIWLPLAPLPEQHRIVEKIDELFSDLDAGVASLERAKANLKRYRASVLKSAVEGSLTEQWRKEHPQAEDGGILLDRILRERREKWEKHQLQRFKEKGKEPPKNWESKYEEPSAPDTSELPELPEGWVWATVEQLLAEGTCNGISIKGSDTPPGVPALRLNAMTESGFDYSQHRFIPIGGDVANDLAIQKDDLFVSRGNGSLHLVGRAVLAQQPPFLLVFPDTMIRVRLTASASLKHFIAKVWQSRLMRRQVETKARTTAGIYKISQADVEEFAVPLPPLAEQEQIVALVEERLSQIDSAEKTIDAELIRSKRLRQSILKRAFEGKLVPQDPKDEPASVLLERIKASRENEQPKKKSKNVKAK